MRDTRKALSPDPGDPRASERTCPRCGARFWRWKRTSTGRCPDCTYDMVVIATAEVEARSGPMYEKRVRGQLRHWLAEAARLGIDPADA